MTQTPITDALIAGHCAHMPTWAQREIRAEVAALEIALDEACQGDQAAVLSCLEIARSRLAEGALS